MSESDSRRLLPLLAQIAPVVRTGEMECLLLGNSGGDPTDPLSSCKGELEGKVKSPSSNSLSAS